MTKTLRVTCQKIGSPELQVTYSFGDTGGTIGRAPTNDLVLRDPSRVISQRHAIIRFETGVFYLIDDSTNGTYLNFASESIAKGSEIGLKNGDVLTIGEYECHCSVEESVPYAPIYPESETESLESSAKQEIPREPVELVGTAGESARPIIAEREGEKQIIPEDVDLKRPSDEERGPVEIGVSDHVPSEQAQYTPPAIIKEDWADLTGEPEPPKAQIPPEPPTRAKQRMKAPARRPSTESKPTAEVSPQGIGYGEQEAVKAFLKGLGLSHKEVAPDNVLEFLETSGSILREITQGVKQILDARTTLKGEFRLDVTTIRPVENNPLKFSIDIEDALTKLLFRPARGYLPPLNAVQEAVDDIQAHHMAVLAGLRAALKTLVAQFDPENLESSFERRTVLDNLIPMARKAKCWETFKDVYTQVATDAENDFLHYLGDEFARAYEEQIDGLKVVRHRERSRS